MLYRINRTVLACAIGLFALGALAGAGTGFWDTDTILRLNRLSRPWMQLVFALSAYVVLSWSALGVVHLFRGRKRLLSGLAASAWVIVTANLLFWGLVQAQFSPIRQLYEKGQVVWIGQRAFLFGHGYWKLSNGYWQHQTLVRLRDGTVYRGPTLDLLATLRENGASFVWGSWCYTGNYPYIRKDLVTGRLEPWPAYASYNRTPGVTIPIWVGSAFVRLGWPRDRYVAEPPTVGPVQPDTLLLVNPSAARIEQAFALMRQRAPGLPRPDSVSWHPITPDTVHTLSRTELAKLSRTERRILRAQERVELYERARTGLALYWIRGRAFPVYVSVPARLERSLDEAQYAELRGGSEPQAEHADQEGESRREASRNRQADPTRSERPEQTESPDREKLTPGG